MLRIGSNSFASSFWSALAESTTTFPSVQKLSLRKSALDASSISSVVSIFPEVTVLDLSFNEIAFIDLDQLSNTSVILWDFSANQIRSIKLQNAVHLLRMNHSFSILLDENPLNCDCPFFAVAKVLGDPQKFHAVLQGVKCFPNNQSIWDHFERQCYPTPSYVLPVIVCVLILIVLVCGLVICVKYFRCIGKAADTPVKSTVRWNSQ